MPFLSPCLLHVQEGFERALAGWLRPFPRPFRLHPEVACPDRRPRPCPVPGLQDAAAWLRGPKVFSPWLGMLGNGKAPGGARLCRRAVYMQCDRAHNPPSCRQEPSAVQASRRGGRPAFGASRRSPSGEESGLLRPLASLVLCFRVSASKYILSRLPSRYPVAPACPTSLNLAHVPLGLPTKYFPSGRMCIIYTYI